MQGMRLYYGMKTKCIFILRTDLAKSLTRVYSEKYAVTSQTIAVNFPIQDGGKKTRNNVNTCVTIP